MRGGSLLGCLHGKHLLLVTHMLLPIATLTNTIRAISPGPLKRNQFPNKNNERDLSHAAHREGQWLGSEY